MAPFLCLIIGMVCIPAGLTHALSSTVWPQVVIALLFWWGAGALLICYGIKYLKMSPKQIWTKWANTESSAAQSARKLRAMTGELTMKQLYEKIKFATFVGGDGSTYYTSLVGCSCPDFAKRKVPCKHMYSLA